MGSFPIPATDPQYRWYRYSFHIDHDLTLFFQPYPFSAKMLLKNDTFLDAKVKFMPSIHLWNKTPIS